MNRHTNRILRCAWGFTASLVDWNKPTVVLHAALLFFLPWVLRVIRSLRYSWARCEKRTLLRAFCCTTRKERRDTTKWKGGELYLQVTHKSLFHVCSHLQSANVTLQEKPKLIHPLDAAIADSAFASFLIPSIEYPTRAICSALSTM